MKFGDAKVGDQITIYTNGPNNDHVMPYKSGHTMLAWVVEQQANGATVLGWKSGEPTPILDPMSIFYHPLSQDHKDMGMVMAALYGSHCECEPYSLLNNVFIPKTVAKQASGCKCTRCLEWYEYAVPVDNFVCYSCRH